MAVEDLIKRACLCLGAAAAGVVGSAQAQPDIKLCQVYGLTMKFGNPAQPARLGDTVGLTLATTSWNIGDVNANWYQIPDPRHPFITMNLYRLKGGRLQQIGQSWVKHGFFALSFTQCGGACQATTGVQLGAGCTDTYDAANNGTQSSLGPRYEVNPWAGRWDYTGSAFQTGGPSNNAIRRRLQVKDADLDPAQNVGAQYFIEAYYVAADDIDVTNSAAWKPVTVSGVAGGTYTFTMSSASASPTEGFAIDAWAGARQTLIAPEVPVVEGQSPDGRVVLASKVTPNGNGTWRYEYAILNIDMDRQVRSLTVPIPSGVAVTNVGFAAVPHHDEAYAWSEATGSPPVRVNGKAIDNAAWVSTVVAGGLCWWTPGVADEAPSNPIRWGTMYSFWFDASSAPADTMALLGLFKAGPVMQLSGMTQAPAAPAPTAFCLGDADGDRNIDFNDLTAVLASWGRTYPAGSRGPGDADNDGDVDFHDLILVMTNWSAPCP